MRITSSRLRSLISESILRDYISLRPGLQEGLLDLLDTGIDTDVSSEVQKAIDEFKGSAPDIPTRYGASYRDAAKSQNVNYYMYDNGKIEVGDTNLPDWPSAKSVLRQFKNSLNDVIPYYTVNTKSGEFPDIDTDDIDDSSVKQALLNYAQHIESSQLQKVRTIYKAALAATGNDRVKAAAICYDGAKALPYIIGIAFFTRYGPNLSIKDRSQLDPVTDDAYKRFRSVNTVYSETTSKVYITISNNPDTDEHTLAHCISDDPIGGLDVVSRPICFFNADKIPDSTIVQHEIDHAIHRIINYAFKKHVTDAKQKTGKQDGREIDYIFEMNKAVIQELSPPPLPGPSRGGLKAESTQQAKPYVDSAADFIKKNMNIGTSSPVSLAKLSFLVLGAIIDRDYSGVGDTDYDTAGREIPPAYVKKGAETSTFRSTYPVDEWSMQAGEIRNAILDLFRKHKRLRKQLGTSYTTAKDVRPFIAKTLTGISTNIVGQEVTQACILAALGPHTSSDFDKLGAVAAIDQLPGESASDLAESVKRRWLLIAGLL